MAKIWDVLYDGKKVFFFSDNSREIGEEIPVGSSMEMGIGRLELRNTKKAGLHFVRFSSAGNFNYCLKLKSPGHYRLGPEYGHKVKSPEDEGDPILKVLRDRGIPVSRLERVEEEKLEIHEYGEVVGADGRASRKYRTNGTIVYEEEERGEHSWHGWGYIKEATVAVVKKEWTDHVSNSHQDACAEIYVWSICTPEELEKVL